MFTENILANDVMTIVCFLEERQIVYLRRIRNYRADIHIIPGFHNKIKEKHRNWGNQLQCTSKYS